MAYSTSKLLTQADCDKATALATDRKDDLVFDQTIATHELTETGKSTTATSASLASVLAQITGTEAAIAALPDGEAKVKEQSRLRKLNDRKDNLTERLQQGGSASVLDTELEVKLLSIQIAEVDVYLGEVATRKAAL